MKRSRFLTLAVLFAILVATFGASTTAAQSEKPLRIKLVVNGVLGDKSFFDSAQRGMDRLKDENFNVETNTVELGIDPAGWETGLSDAMAAGDYDVLIAGTTQMTQYLAKRVQLYPDKYFIFFDDTIPYSDKTLCVDGCKNVYSMVYAQNEGSFMAGVYAAAITTSGLDGTNPDSIIGAVGGQDVPVIEDFVVGYEQGACLVDPKVQVLVQYAGGWNDPATGKEITLAMYEQKADIVFQIAGGTGVGVFEAAQEQNHYAIGVDSDQATIIAATDPEQAKHILTSMQKNVDNSLYRAIDLYIKGTLPFGTTELLGIQAGGVGLAYNDIYYNATPEKILNLMDAVEKAVVAGDIKIDTVFQDRVDANGYVLAKVGQGCDKMPPTKFDVQAAYAGK